MSKLMKLIGEGRAMFASVLCLLTIGLLVPSARAENPIFEYVCTDNQWETERNPHALPTSMPHWLSSLCRHEVYTNYQGFGYGYRSRYMFGTWFLRTNTYYCTSLPVKNNPLYENTVRVANWASRGDRLQTTVSDKTCLANIERDTRTAIDNAVDVDTLVGKRVSLALCQLLRPHEFEGKSGTAPFPAGYTAGVNIPKSEQNGIFFSNLTYNVGVQYKSMSYCNPLAGQCLDGTTFFEGGRLIYFDNYLTNSKGKITKLCRVTPKEMVKEFDKYYGPGLKNCIDTLNLMPDDWNGTYLLHNRGYKQETIEETFVWTNTVTGGPAELRPRTRTVTHPDAWPMFDEDVHLDRADVLLLKCACYALDTVVKLSEAYQLPDGPVGKDPGPEIQQLMQWQRNFHDIGYTAQDRPYMDGNPEKEHTYRIGYDERIERAFHDFFHVVPTFLKSVDDKDAMAAARASFMSALECFLDADAFITGNWPSKTGHDYKGQREADQLHLFEFAELELGDEGCEKNIAGYREIIEKAYASLMGTGTAEAVQQLAFAGEEGLGKKLGLKAGDKLLDFSGIGAAKDGTIQLDMNPFFDGSMTPRDFVTDVNACVTTNGPSHWVLTHASTNPDMYPGVAPSNLVNQLVLNVSEDTVSPTLVGLYPSGTFASDIRTMTKRYPATGKTAMSGFSRYVKACDPRVTVTTENSPYVLEEGCTYTAAPAVNKSGGAFQVSEGATLTGTNVTFLANEANWPGGAIDNAGTVTLKDADFTGNKAAASGAIQNTGTLNLDGVTFSGNVSDVGIGGAFINGGTVNLDGPVTFATETDTAHNTGTLNWNLADGKAGQFNGYDKLTIGDGTLQLTVGDYEEATNEFVIATGEFFDVADKDTFVITNASGASSATATIQIGDRVAMNGTIYELSLAENLEADPPTTNLVLTAIKVDLSRIIVDSTLPGGYKPGDEIEGKPGFFFGVNYFTEMPEAGLLAGTETLEIAGSAAITNAVALNAPAKLILDAGATLSIMGDGAALAGLGETASIDGQGVIYLDKDVDDPELKAYTDKRATGCNITVARASVTDDEAKQTTKTEGGKEYYEVATSAVTIEESQETNAVVTADIVAKGEDETDGILLKTDDTKPLVIAGSVTADAAKPQTLKLVKEQAADLVVNGKVRGFETVTVENKNAEGKMTATTTLAANKDITILNEGHLEAKAQAGANLFIKNTTANTLIGEYSGQNVIVTNTAEGVAQDIDLQAYGTDAIYGKVTLVGEDGSVYSNVVIVAGKNKTPGDLSANDGSGEVRWIGTNTFSGSVVVNAKANGMEGESPLLRFANADAVMAKIVIPLEISGECIIRSTEKGTAKANDAITLKDGAVLGGNTRLDSTCFDDKFVLEGTVTMKDGAEISRTYAGNDTGKFEVPADATLKLQGATIDVDEFALNGTLLVESGMNKIKMGGTPSADEAMVLTLKKGASLEFPGFFNQGVINLEGGECIGDIYNYRLLNWDLAEGTTTLNWAKISNEGGTFRLTVGDAASGTRYVLATNVEEAVTDTFTVTNSVAGGAATTVKAGGVCKVGNTFYALDVKDDKLTLTALEPVKLSDVAIIDDETGKTNATAVVKFGDMTVGPDEDGTYEVPAGYPLTVVYKAADYEKDDGLMFGPGLENKSVQLGELSGDTSMNDEPYASLKPTAQPRWVDATDGRTLALDVRERIVVGSPNEVLPIAYSTNFWGEVKGGVQLAAAALDPQDEVSIVYIGQSNGYAEWQPSASLYGKYTLVHQCLNDLIKPLEAFTNEIYYSQPYALTWSNEGGTLAVTNAGAAIASGDTVLGYDIVTLATQPDEGYVLSRKGFQVLTNGVEIAGAVTGDAKKGYRFDMPYADAEIKSAYVKATGVTVNGEDLAYGSGKGWEYDDGELKLSASEQTMSAFTLSGVASGLKVAASAAGSATLTLESFTNDVTGVDGVAALKLSGGSWSVKQTGTNYLASGAGASAVSVNCQSVTFSGTGTIFAAPGKDEKGALKPGIGIEAGTVKITEGTYTGTVDPQLAYEPELHRMAFSNGDDTWSVQDACYMDLLADAGLPLLPSVTNVANTLFDVPIPPTIEGKLFRGWMIKGTDPRQYWDFTTDTCEKGQCVKLVAVYETIESDSPSSTVVPKGGDKPVVVDTFEKAVYIAPDGAVVEVSNTNLETTVEKHLIIKKGEGATLDITPGEGLVAKVGGDDTVYVGEETNDVVVVVQDAGTDDKDKSGVTIEDAFCIVAKSVLDEATTNEEAKAADALVASIAYDIDVKSSSDSARILDITPVLTLTTLKNGEATSTVAYTNDFPLSGESVLVTVPCGSIKPVAVIHSHEGKATTLRPTTDPMPAALLFTYDAVANKATFQMDEFSEVTLLGEEKAENLSGNITGSQSAGAFETQDITVGGDASLTATKYIELNGTTTIRGPLTLNAPEGGITNKGTLAWDVSGDNTKAKLNNLDAIVSTPDALYKILVDAAQTDGDVVGVYEIAANAVSAIGKNFSLAGGSVNTTIDVADGADPDDVVAKTLYIGAKAYSLRVEADGTLVFEVKWGKFAITYDAMGPYFTAGETTVVSDSYVHAGYSLPEAPVRQGYAFLGWYDGVTNGAAQATYHTPLCYTNEHTMFARWQANGGTPVSSLTLADGTVTPSGNVGNNLVLPDTIDGKPVLKIGKAAFAAANYKQSQITNLVTGSYLRSIEPGAFNQVTTLKTLKISEARDFDNPSTIVPVKIGKRAFAGTRIESLEVAAGTEIGEQAFRGCSYLKEIAFFGDVKNDSLTADAFSLCGFTNGTGKIKLYMSDAFKTANADFLTALKNGYANSKIEIADLSGYSPATSVSVNGLDVSQPTEMTLKVAADALIAGTMADVTTIKVLYREKLSDSEKEYAPTSVVSDGDGTYTVKFTAPNDGRSGFVRVIVK